MVQKTTAGRARLSRRARPALQCAILLLTAAVSSVAHPLGNFTINHYSRLSPGAAQVRVRYVVDMAEIPTFQVLQGLGVNDEKNAPAPAVLDAYALQSAAEYGKGLIVTVDRAPVPLALEDRRISLLPGAGGLSTLRLECDFAGAMPLLDSVASHRLRFEDKNDEDRIGWREIVAAPQAGITVFDSSAFGNGVTDELKAYPQDMLQAPLNERAASLSFTVGAMPPGAKALLLRNGRKLEVSRDRFAELIAAPQLSLGVLFLGLVFAVALGGLHALSPGHGKTVVAAYLVGTRGTARHAAFLGLTVTITHTAGVFALGFITLFAAQYVVPERLYPIISLVSGVIVLVMGLVMLLRRVRVAQAQGHDHGLRTHLHNHDLEPHTHEHSHPGHEHSHEHPHEHQHAGMDQSHSHAHGGIAHSHGEHQHEHSHGGRVHSHLPPGADGAPVTWRSMLALGISGGLLPCPSALVVLLSAIWLHRVAYGLVLVVAFSAGLAIVLTSIGLAFVYARRFIALPFKSGRLVRFAPVFSAAVITTVGALMCYQALNMAGVNLLAFATR